MGRVGRSFRARLVAARCGARATRSQGRGCGRCRAEQSRDSSYHHHWASSARCVSHATREDLADLPTPKSGASFVCVCGASWLERHPGCVVLTRNSHQSVVFSLLPDWKVKFFPPLNQNATEISPLTQNEGNWTLICKELGATPDNHWCTPARVQVNRRSKAPSSVQMLFAWDLQRRVARSGNLCSQFLCLGSLLTGLSGV